ncbi:hypothetical protein IAU60_006775 [Kwoniella sp. DSM 27419]
MAESSTSTSPPPAKRRKARRACDPCRARKLRCEYPEDSPERCRACLRSNAQCDATQPAKIDKRRLRALVDLATTEEQKQWVAQQIAQRGVYVASTDKGALRKARPSAAGDPMQLMAKLSGNWRPSEEPSSSTHHSPMESVDSKRSIPLPLPVAPPLPPSSEPGPSSPRRTSVESPSFKTTGLEPRLQGPTASINLLGDLPESSAAVAKHDRRYGLFRVTDDWVFGGNTDEPMREGSLAEQQLREDVVAQLIHFYTTQIAPVNPVIPPHRVSAAVQSTPLLLASVVSVAALSRDVPPEIYANVRHRLKLQLSDTIGGGSTFPQIQAMLVSGMSHELHGDTNMEGGSNCWLRIGSAIRQAQDIGLHRLDARHWLPEMYGGAYGQPLTINLLDCEDPLANADLLQTPDLSHAFQAELFHVSCLLGDIMQTIYRPRALEKCTDQLLESILVAIDRRIAIIDSTSAFLRDPSSLQAGLLNLTISCTEIIFFRSFVKMNRKLPRHLSFRPTAARWTAAVRRARTAIAWMEIHGDVLLDCWLLVKYAFTYSALAQYYHFAAERDPESLESLSIAKDIMNRWALGHRQDRPIAARSKIADIVNIFYKAAQDLAQQDVSVNPLSQPVFAPQSDAARGKRPVAGESASSSSIPPSSAHLPHVPLDSMGHPGYGPAQHGSTIDAANALLGMDTSRPPSASGPRPAHAQPMAFGPGLEFQDRADEGFTGRVQPANAASHVMPQAAPSTRFDPSTLDDWLADVFRLHGASDGGFMGTAQESHLPAAQQWPEGLATAPEYAIYR